MLEGRDGKIIDDARQPPIEGNSDKAHFPGTLAAFPLSHLHCPLRLVIPAGAVRGISPIEKRGLLCDNYVSLDSLSLHPYFYDTMECQKSWTYAPVESNSVQN